MMHRHATTVALLALLSGCAVYSTYPLNLGFAPPHTVSGITVDPAQMPLAALASHRFDPGDGLDIDEVAMLAVANNPLLRLARDDYGVARAQAFAAGLLPDPQLSLTRDFPTNGNATNTSAFNLGVNYDFNALLVRSAKKASAQAQQRKVHLNLLWQEWQVVSQARLLFVRNLQQQRLLRVLEDTRALFLKRYEIGQEALRQGNTTLDAASADLIALQDIERQINDLVRQINRNRLDLNLLLGIAPEVMLDLRGNAAPAPLDAARIAARLPRLARVRPDLLALRAGYESQELRFRQAVLAQFPALNIGITRARDTSDLYTLGFGVTMSLPIFNRNQGNVAIERATRQRLNDEFEQRLGAAYSEVHGILGEQRVLERQLADANALVAELERVVARAEKALATGNMNALTYAGLRASLLNKRVEAVTLEQKILEQRVALQTLVPGDLPPQVREKGTPR